MTTKKQDYMKFMLEKTDETINIIKPLIKEVLDIEIHSVGIQVNNALNEMSKEFEKSGMSMYSDGNEVDDYNIVGDAIIIDMSNRIKNAMDKLQTFGNVYDSADSRKKELKGKWNKMGIIRRILYIIKKPTIVSELVGYLPDEMEGMKRAVAEYEQIDDSIFNYNLKDNLLQSLMDYIGDTELSSETISRWISRITPTLKKLGLDDVSEQFSEKLKQRMRPSKPWEVGTPVEPIILEGLNNNGKGKPLSAELEQ